MTRPERVFGPGPYSLVRDGRAVAPVAVAETYATRRKGLSGTDRVEGALWITRCPSVHMIGMRYAIDVAVVDREGLVLLVRTLRPWTGGTWFRRRASATVEAPAGSMASWGVVPGSRLWVDRGAPAAGAQVEDGRKGSA
ncbi:MAG TPA: DUF192 domain-containing protein [Friedmanniella sp.]